MELTYRRNLRGQYIYTVNNLIVGAVFRECMDDYARVLSWVPCVRPDAMLMLGDFKPKDRKVDFGGRGMLKQAGDPHVIFFDTPEEAKKVLEDLLLSYGVTGFDDTWHLLDKPPD